MLANFPKDPKSANTCSTVETPIVGKGHNDKIVLAWSIQVNFRPDEPGSERMTGGQWVIAQASLDINILVKNWQGRVRDWQWSFDEWYARNFLRAEGRLLLLGDLTRSL